MLGMAEPYLRLPYFYSDQYDLGMEYRGYAPTWDRVAFRGSPDRREFIAFWLSGGRVAAAINANVWKVAKPITALIEGRAVVPVERLEDPGIPLEELAP
jgi:3-phenylpropionate/trans-cinnamate dioxygenase ferredoxin reductase subunit